MTNLDSTPTVHCYPHNLVHKSKEEKQQYFDHVLTRFVDTYVLQKFSLTKMIMCETTAFAHIFFTLLLMQFKDTAKQGDGYKKSY